MLSIVGTHHNNRDSDLGSIHYKICKTVYAHRLIMDLVFDSEMLFVEFNVITWCGMSYSNVNSKQNVNRIVNSENVSSVTVTVKI